MVLTGEIVNAIAVAGILAAHAVTTGFAEARPRGSAVGRQADGVRGPTQAAAMTTVALR